ncbi:MAG: diacylglycerol kinase [Planctomycetaceae bacterium]
MNSSVTTRPHHPSPSAEMDVVPRTKRACWRERLVEAEAGYRIGLRSASSLFAYLFGAGVVGITGIVLGFAPQEWLMLSCCVAAVMASELLLAAIRNLAAPLRKLDPTAAHNALRLATAASLTVTLAACHVALWITAGHIGVLFD